MTTKKKPVKKQAKATKEVSQVEITTFLASIFRDLGIENFITWDAHIPEMGEFSITLQRQAGITPAQKLAQVHEENRELRKRIAEFEALARIRAEQERRKRATEMRSEGE